MQVFFLGRNIWLFCKSQGLFCGDIGLFCSDTGLFCQQSTSASLESINEGICLEEMLCSLAEIWGIVRVANSFIFLTNAFAPSKKELRFVKECWWVLPG